MKYKVMEKDDFQVAGVKREYSCVNGENLIGIPKLWDQVNTDGTSDKLAQLNNGQIQGLLGICVNKKDSESNQAIDYWVAAEYEGKAQEGFLSMEIPASKWVVFEVHGPMPEAMQKMWEQIYSEWFPTSCYEHGGSPGLEVYPDGNIDSPNYYSEIWISVK